MIKMVQYGVLVLLVVLVTGCGTFRHIKYPKKHTYLPISSKNNGITKEYPKSYTVYPFKNFSWESSAAIRAQRETAMAFTLIGSVANIQETADLASTPYTLKDAIRVAKKQKSDAVIVGEVVTEDSIFLILFAYNYVNIKLTIYDTKDGSVLWLCNGWGFATDFAGMIYWVPNPMIPAIKHIFWSRVVNNIYHRINLDAVNAIRPELLEFKEFDKK